ncbi:MAG: hypothetical protein PHF56_01470 [Desulfuromonadaceae bacterium]|nr:hypothetical protein [Desulfuromonadaceae bacterium]
MAKQNYLKLAVVIVLTMAAASTVHATTSTIVTGSIGGSSFSSSNKVSCYYAGDNGDATATNYSSTAYGIACGHAAGDKVVAAKSGDAKLYFSAAASGSNGAADAANVNDTTDLTTGWSSM